MAKRIGMMAIAIALLGCETFLPATDADRSMEIPAPAGVAFTALKATFAELLIDITDGDAETGYLVGERVYGSGVFMATTIMRYRVTVYDAAGGSRIQARLTFGSEGERQYEATADMYADFWDAFRAQLARASE